MSNVVQPKKKRFQAEYDLTIDNRIEQTIKLLTSKPGMQPAEFLTEAFCSCLANQLTIMSILRDRCEGELNAPPQEKTIVTPEFQGMEVKVSDSDGFTHLTWIDANGLLHSLKYAPDRLGQGVQAEILDAVSKILKAYERAWTRLSRAR